MKDKDACIWDQEKLELHFLCLLIAIKCMMLLLLPTLKIT